MRRGEEKEVKSSIYVVRRLVLVANFGLLKESNVHVTITRQKRPKKHKKLQMLQRERRHEKTRRPRKKLLLKRGLQHIKHASLQAGRSERGRHVKKRSADRPESSSNHKRKRQGGLVFKEKGLKRP